VGDITGYKFKVWDVNNKRWYNPSILRVDSSGQLYYQRDGTYLICPFIRRHDKKGFEIYEGNVLKTGTIYVEDDNVVRYCEDCRGFSIKNSHANCLPIPDDCEVIGHIFEQDLTWG
jgi:hypothetical protein